MTTALSTIELSQSRKAWLHSLFTTALEGGIGYWSQCFAYHWSANADGTTDDLDGFFADVMSNEGEWGIWDDDVKDKSALRIDLEVMRRGAELFRRHCIGELDSQGRERTDPEFTRSTDVREHGHYWMQFLASEATNGAHGDYDSEVADQVVQWGLFGAGIYG